MTLSLLQSHNTTSHQTYGDFRVTIQQVTKPTGTSESQYNKSPNLRGLQSHNTTSHQTYGDFRVTIQQVTKPTGTSESQYNKSPNLRGLQSHNTTSHQTYGDFRGTFLSQGTAMVTLATVQGSNWNVVCIIGWEKID